MAAAPVIEIFDRPENVPEVEESGVTLEENARLKAHAVARACGCPALADDTGLEVIALDGAPGVHSARYAGPGSVPGDNIAKLLRELAVRNSEPLSGPGPDAGNPGLRSENAGGSPMQGLDRAARFRTVMVLACPDGRELMAEGSVDGSIIEAPRGEAGFGYDPIFVPSGSPGWTFAEMTAAQKDSLSHRAAALNALLDQVAELDEEAKLAELARLGELALAQSQPKQQ